MNILFATHGYKPAFRIGGPIISIAKLAENLVRRGHKVVVFTSNSNLDEDLDVPMNQSVMVDGVEVWYFQYRDPIKKYFPFIPYFSQSAGYYYIPELRGILAQRIREFDIVHTHVPLVYPTFAVAKKAIKHGIPVVYHQRGVFSPAYLHYRSLKKRIYISLFEKPIMKKAALLVALTKAEVDSYRGLGVNTPCCIIPNGIDVSDYSQQYRGELYLSAEDVITPNNFVILFLARLHEIKGAEFLIDVFLRVFKYFPNARLVIAGPDEQNLKEALLAKVETADALSKVFMPGMVTGKFKRDLLARSDLFCQPSLAEGFSVGILEAMASSTPVLVTPQCNFPEIESASAGWVVEKDMEKWVDKITLLLKQSSQMQTNGANAINLVKRQYTWETIVDQFEDAYVGSLKETSKT
jgi:glycosyltransferase involved in cell wall biosynthesis